MYMFQFVILVTERNIKRFRRQDGAPRSRRRRLKGLLCGRYAYKPRYCARRNARRTDLYRITIAVNIEIN